MTTQVTDRSWNEGVERQFPWIQINGLTSRIKISKVSSELLEVVPSEEYGTNTSGYYTNDVVEFHDKTGTTLGVVKPKTRHSDANDMSSDQDGETIGDAWYHLDLPTSVTYLTRKTYYSGGYLSHDPDTYDLEIFKVADFDIRWWIFQRDKASDIATAGAAGVSRIGYMRDPQDVGRHAPAYPVIDIDGEPYDIGIPGLLDLLGKNDGTVEGISRERQIEDEVLEAIVALLRRRWFDGARTVQKIFWDLALINGLDNGETHDGETIKRLHVTVDELYRQFALEEVRHSEYSRTPCPAMEDNPWTAFATACYQFLERDNRLLTKYGSGTEVGSELLRWAQEQAKDDSGILWDLNRWREDVHPGDKGTEKVTGIRASALRSLIGKKEIYDIQQKSQF